MNTPTKYRSEELERGCVVVLFSVSLVLTSLAYFHAPVS